MQTSHYVYIDSLSVDPLLFKSYFKIFYYNSTHQFKQDEQDTEYWIICSSS